ncbi:MAG: ATP-binding protein [Bacteroidota bacterium]
MNFTKLLGFRLFVIVLSVMVAGTALFTTLNVGWQTNRHMSIAVKTAARTSDVIKRSTHYSMLLNRREDIYQIIKTIGNEPGIETIRIYNKQGVISFSTDSSQVGSVVDMNAEACNVCHGSDLPPSSLNLTELTRVFQSPRGHGVLGMITPIYNETSCSTADCHAHDADQTVLGVLDVMLPLTDVEAAMAETTQEQILLALFLVAAVSSITGIFIWLMVNIPTRQLTLGTAEIMRGNLAHRIPVRSTDEVGALAQSFNQMTGELQRARKEIDEWTETLEFRVAAKTDELRRAQQNMIHVEKMASLGQLAATVAHELNNPLEGVLTYAKLLRKKITAGIALSPEAAAEVHEELTLIADETARCGAIVTNLLLFSKQRVGVQKEEDLRAIVQRSLKLIDHHLKMNSIRLVVKLSERPVVMICDAAQIEQALLALMMNAVEAMPEGGDLSVVFRNAQNGIELIVRDTGCGINEEDIPRIFEPFFTTKDQGKGTGLGLAVVHGIVQRYGGTIDVQSKRNEGTTFSIIFPTPLEPPVAQAPDHVEQTG